MVLVLDPTLPAVEADLDPGPDLGPVTGRTIGFRVDMLWRSWDWVSDEWAAALKDDGANVNFWRARGRSGDEGVRTDAELDAFLADQDAAVVGLANCGSCTSWTVRDAVTAARTGIPTVAVVTDYFQALATTLAARAGRPGLRRVPLPYPLDILPEERVRDIARDHYGSFLRTLGVRGGLAGQ